MTVPKVFRNWPTHWWALLTGVVMLVSLSFPSLSATEWPWASKLLDTLMRMNGLLCGSVLGYWVSRFFLEELYAAKNNGQLSPGALIEFERLRINCVIGFAIAWAVFVRP